MSAYLRATFRTHRSLEEFIDSTSLPITRVFRKGHLLYPDTKVTRRAKITGVNILVSAADMADYKGQIRASKRFFKKHSSEVRKLSKKCQGDLILDFGFSYNAEFDQNHSFPPELLLALGKLGIVMNVCIYPP